MGEAGVDRSWRASHWQYAIIRASERLSPAAKLLYQLIVELDRGPRGAFLSQRGLASELGLSSDHVGDLRQHLVTLKLLRCERRERAKRGEARESWFAVLPRELGPPHPAEGATTTERRAWIHEMAGQLDRLIQEAEQGGSSPMVSARQRAVHRRTSPVPIGELLPLRPPNIGELSGGDGGNSPVVPSETPATVAPSVTLNAVGQESSTAAPDGAEPLGSRPREGVGHPVTDLSAADQALRNRWHQRRAEQRRQGTA